jgi:hypothetical protein
MDTYLYNRFVTHSIPRSTFHGNIPHRISFHLPKWDLWNVFDMSIALEQETEKLCITTSMLTLMPVAAIVTSQLNFRSADGRTIQKTVLLSVN